MEITSTLNATSRDGLGKGFNRQLRMKGDLPAVVYGPKATPFSVSLNYDEFWKYYEKNVNKVPIVELKVSGKANAGSYRVAIRDIQFHPVTDRPLHIDFYLFNDETPMTIGVPVKLVGKPIGVENGGLLQFMANTIRITSVPSKLPNRIDVDVSSLDVGASLIVGQIRKNVPFVIVEEDAKVVARVIALRKAKATTEGEAAAK